jgi:peptide/nickel transport system ATP-binding protein
MKALLDVTGLDVWFGQGRDRRQVVKDVTFAMAREKIGIVGESGSGKSVSMRAVLGLLPNGATATAQRLRFDGLDITQPTSAGRRGLLGRRASLVLQDPRHALNPVMTIGAQITEVYRLHKKLSRHEAWERMLAALETVRIRDPLRVSRLYPHETSGGMGQRAMIAMMLAPDPDLLIADEPTSALDATVEASVLETLNEQVSQRGMGLVLISHDLDLVASFCDRVLVMYQGRIVEELPASRLSEAQHPYTRGLIGCVPRLGEVRDSLPVLARDPSWSAP